MTIGIMLSEHTCTIIEVAETKYSRKAHQICKSHLILHYLLLVFAEEGSMSFLCSQVAELVLKDDVLPAFLSDQMLVKRENFRLAHQLPELQRYMYKLGALFLLVALAFSAEPYQKVVHNTDKQARCLDGSSPALLIHEGDPKKILLYMQGGGVCGAHSFNETMESCWQRSKTYFGSSIYWPKTTYGEGLLSTDPEKNIFANWTKVIMPYCDGAFHQGATKKPYIYKGDKIYFRGGINTRSHFQYIHNRFNLTSSQRIVLTGSSAGAISALAWSSYLQKMTPNADFKLIPDSGVLIRIDDSELSNLFKVSNVDENAPHAECAAKYGKENEYHCLSVRGILPYTVGQALFVQSGYDQFMISMRMDLPACLTTGGNGFSLYRCDEQEVNTIQTYRRTEYYPYLDTIISAGHMVWSIDCAMHSIINFDHYYQSPNLKVPMGTGITMQQAIKDWLFDGKNVTVIDVAGWPNNVPCSK